jgi:diaminopimelate decarboxylase
MMDRQRGAALINPEVIRLPTEAIQQALSHSVTPFYLYEEATIRRNCRRLKAAFGRHFPRFQPLYAVKANANPHIVRIILDEGFGLDCSSPAEVWLAKELNATGMHTGNYSTELELREILGSPNLLLNLDDVSLIETVQRIGTPAFLSLRVNPGITAGSMESLLLAGQDAKFGIPWERAVDAYRRLVAAGAKRFGMHMMTGSNVLDPRYFATVARKLLTIARDVQRELGIRFECLNIGGGFGVPYHPDEPTLDLDQVAAGVYQAFDEVAGGDMPALMVEPGRLITADAGFLVTQVHALKDSYKRYVGVDAGMNDLPRPANYGAYHHISVLDKDGQEPGKSVNVVGRLCENNDQFARDRLLPPIEIGDVLAIHNAGAHCYAMSHNYNGRPRCAEYLSTQTGEIKLVRRTETVADLYRNII